MYTRLKDFPDDDPSCERNVNLQKEGKLLVKVTTSKTNDLNASTVQQHRTIFYLSHKFTPMCSTVWSSHKSSIALTIPKNTKQTNVGLCVWVNWQSVQACPYLLRWYVHVPRKYELKKKTFTPGTWYMIFSSAVNCHLTPYDQLTTWHMTCMSHDLTTYDQIPHRWHIWPRMTKYMTLYMTYMTMYDKIYDYIYDIYMTRYDQIWPHDIYMTRYEQIYDHTYDHLAAHHINFFGTHPTLTQVPPSRLPSTRPTLKENVAIKEILK